MTDRTLKFTEKELARIRLAAQQVNTSYVEFIHTATMQAVSECEGMTRDLIRTMHEESAARG